MLLIWKVQGNQQIQMQWQNNILQKLAVLDSSLPKTFSLQNFLANVLEFSVHCAIVHVCAHIEILIPRNEELQQNCPEQWHRNCWNAFELFSAYFKIICPETIGDQIRYIPGSAESHFHLEGMRCLSRTSRMSWQMSLSSFSTWFETHSWKQSATFA